MLKIFIMSIALMTTPFASASLSPKAEQSKSFAVSKLDESDLSVDTYEPGDSSMSKWYTVRKEIDSDGTFSVVLRMDPEKIFELIDDAAGSAGLLTGKTPYEILRKNNSLVMDYYMFRSTTEIMILDKATREWKKKTLMNVKPRSSTYWTSLEPEIKIIPRSNVEKMIIRPMGNLKDMRFVDKNNMKKSWGMIFSSDGKNKTTFIDIFREPGVSRDDEDFQATLAYFVSELIRIAEEDFVPASKDYNVMIANQNSIKFQYKKGPNIVIKNENKNRDIPFSPYWLLFPSILIVAPYSYFAIRKVLKK